MAAVYSSMLALDTSLPNFKLINVINNTYLTSNEYCSAQVNCVMFICNHCPYVKHIFPVLSEWINSFKDDSRVRFVAISSNDIIAYPDDAPDKMKLFFDSYKLTIPYLFDETQDIAKNFKAECTPEFYVFDQNQKLKYRGRFDGSNHKNNTSTDGTELKEAVRCMLNNEKVSDEQKPSIGCNIKWKV